MKSLSYRKNLSQSLAAIILAASCVSGSLVLGFVAKINEQGEFRRWDFDNPPSSVSENVFNRATRAIRFSLAEDAFTPDNRIAELNAVRAAFDQWESIPNSIIDFEEGPLAPSSQDINPSDGTNIVMWAKTSRLVNGERSDISGRLGLAFTLFFADGRMAAADIALNGVDHNWFATPDALVEDSRFIEGTVIHEIGHVLGLDHSPIGTATMFARDGSGLGFQSGLTPDETTFAQSIYQEPTNGAQLATLQGQITADGNGVLGAAVFLEDPAGHVIAGTVAIESTDKNSEGFYQFLGVPPGSYLVRAQPLDSASATRRLVTGRDISFSRFDLAEIDFKPTAPQAVTLSAGQTSTVDLALDPTPPAFRIGRIRQFTDSPTGVRAGNSPITITQGEQGLTIGVFGSSLPTEDVELLVTGDGLTLGPTEVTTRFFSNTPHLFRTVSVAPNATPGIRSFIVKQDNNLAYATGFIEVRAADPDDNFDGLSDNFQRQHFAPFTASIAAPSADPDGDGFTNLEEALAGTNPNVPNQDIPQNGDLEIDSVSLTLSGAQIEFNGNAGITYQLFARDDLDRDPWTPIGAPVAGTGLAQTLIDPDADSDIRFYEVRIVE